MPWYLASDNQGQPQSLRALWSYLNQPILSPTGWPCVSLSFPLSFCVVTYSGRSQVVVCEVLCSVKLFSVSLPECASDFTILYLSQGYMVKLQAYLV